MRIARATKNDFSTTNDFLSSCASFWDNRQFSFNNEKAYEDWDDEDEDKKLIIKIKKKTIRGILLR
jgi:hypothetical protein